MFNRHECTSWREYSCRLRLDKLQLNPVRDIRNDISSQCNLFAGFFSAQLEVSHLLLKTCFLLVPPVRTFPVCFCFTMVCRWCPLAIGCSPWWPTHPLERTTARGCAVLPRTRTSSGAPSKPHTTWTFTVSQYIIVERDDATVSVWGENDSLTDYN